ncbi:hypothetical protein ACFX2J_041950 [Malus domestica]
MVFAHCNLTKVYGYEIQNWTAGISQESRRISCNPFEVSAVELINALFYILYMFIRRMSKDRAKSGGWAAFDLKQRQKQGLEP